MNKKKNNIIKFPSSISKVERKIEAILFAASEPLDIDTIEKRLQSKSNVKKILEKIQIDYKKRQLKLYQLLFITNRLQGPKSNKYEELHLDPIQLKY